MKRTLEIIIPAYNMINNIENTLSSIAIQQGNIDFEVLIVNDKSDYLYTDVVNKYSKYMNIREIDLEHNSGPGIAREAGILNSSSDYIMFIDADDYLYLAHSLYFAISTIKNNDNDVLIGNFLYERDNKIEVRKNDVVFLHGKVYKRSFLEEHNIHFNNTRQNEDNGFNKLIFLLEPKVTVLDDILYVYKENPTSITRRNNREYKFLGLEGYAYNMMWSLEEASKRNASNEEIRLTLLSIFISSYYYYIDLYHKYDVNKILKWFKPLYNLFTKYKYTINEMSSILVDEKKILEGKNPLNITFDEYVERIKNYND